MAALLYHLCSNVVIGCMTGRTSHRSQNNPLIVLQVLTISVTHCRTTEARFSRCMNLKSKEIDCNNWHRVGVNNVRECGANTGAPKQGKPLGATCCLSERVSSLSLHLMATRIVSWSDDDHIISPNLSETSSVISFDSILSDKFEGSLGNHGTTHMAESHPTHTASQVIEPNGTGTSTSTTIHPEIGAVDRDGSFMRHNKYFFKDGNVTFLVRDAQSWKWYATGFIV